jgi:hypothetical protein
MSDRSTVLTYLALLLRRMNELALRTGQSDMDMKDTQEEARALHERWDACMRELHPNWNRRGTNL